MSNRIERARLAVGAWIAAHDTRGIEFLLALASMATGYLAVATRPDGKPVAPIVNTTLSFFAREPSEWARAAGALGVLILVALAIGTRKPESTWPRAWVMALTMSFYIAVAIGNAQQIGGFAIGLRYAVTALGALWATIVLVVEAQVQQHERAIDAHSKGAIDRAVISFNRDDGIIYG